MSVYALTEEMIRRVRTLVREEIATHFQPPKGQRAYPGGQREIARRMHISQPTLNRCLLQEKGDFGIDVLLGLRAYFAETGRPMTLDQLLGLEPLPNASAVVTIPPGDVEARLRALESQLEALKGQRRSRSHVRQRAG